MMRPNPTTIVYIFWLVIIFLSFSIYGQKNSRIFPEIPPYVLAPAKIAFDNGPDPMSSRLFRTTEFRTQINLSGFWDFITDADESGEKEKYFIHFPQPETRLDVPGTWNVIPRYWQYQGPAWYRRTFKVPIDGNLRIHFGGVFYNSKIWLDGELLGDHEGAYSPFDFVARNVKKGRHTIVVYADNRLDDKSLPKDGADWFPYGGIFRPVYAEIVSSLYIDRFHIICSDVTEDQVKLTVRVFINNLTEQTANKRLQLSIDGQPLYSKEHKISPGKSISEFTAFLKNPKLWCIENPDLYLAHVILGEDEDDRYDRFGIRTFDVDGCMIKLNNKRFKLMGANHHDDHPDWGSALPPHIIRQDIEILKRMGANAVREHYPPSEMFMDYCDQAGLVFMNEVPSWQYRPDQLAQDLIKNKIKRQFFDMVYRDMNHPSVISWCLGNEWRDFEKAYDDIKELVDYARTVDSTHFLTFVTGGAHIDRSNALVDIICTNWAKYQWYWNPTLGEEDEGQKASTVLDEDLGKFSNEELEEIHKKFPDKPVILTEFGGSGSQAGWHNWGNVKWSEEYQARNVWDSGEYGLAQEWISGGCVWQFCDTRSTPYRILGSRLRGWNVKGVVDGYRQPKMAFYKLQELFHLYGEKQP